MGIRARKVILRMLTVLLIVIAVVLVVRAVFNYTLGRRLDAAIKQAKADGIPVSSWDLFPPCSVQENGAPLWKAAEALFVLPKDQETVQSLAAMKSLLGGSPIDKGSRPVLAGWIAKNRRAIGLIAEASESKCFRFDSSGKLLYDRMLPDYTKLIHAARLFALDSVLRAEDGDVNGALEECRRGILFFSKLLESDMNFMMTNLIMIHGRKLLTASVNRIVQGQDLDTAVLSGWIRDLDESEWRRQYISGIRAEGVFTLEIGLTFIAGGRESVEGLYPLARAWSRVWNWIIRPFLKYQVLENMELSRNLEELSTLSYFRQKAYFEKKGPRLDNPPWYLRPLGQWFPNYQSAFMKEATLEASALAAKAGLACKIYKNKFGRYPENLDALVPEILDRVPIDPFTERPLVYKLMADEVLIYSLGSNEKDDGGRQTSDIGQLVMEKDDDWAWREKTR